MDGTTPLSPQNQVPPATSTQQEVSAAIEATREIDDANARIRTVLKRALETNNFCLAFFSIQTNGKILLNYERRGFPYGDFTIIQKMFQEQLSKDIKKEQKLKIAGDDDEKDRGEDDEQGEEGVEIGREEKVKAEGMGQEDG